MQKLMGISVQERDLAVLLTLFESRIMTIRHISSIHFGGRQEAAKKRIQKLKKAGFIDERKRRVNEPAVLFLTTKASDVLSKGGHLTQYSQTALPAMSKRSQVSDLTVAHELQVMDIKSAVTEAIRATAKYELAEFSTWPALNRFKANPLGSHDVCDHRVHLLHCTRHHSLHHPCS